MTPKKSIILDANILIRSVLGSNVPTLLAKLSDDIRFFTPDICILEAREHLPKITAKKNIPQDLFDERWTWSMNIINEIAAPLYTEYQRQAEERISMRDPEDWPVVACALLLDAHIWTEDKDFFGTGIAVWTTDRITLYASS